MNPPVFYLHIPKTGGTSLVNALLQLASNRYTGRRWNEFNGSGLEGYDFIAGHWPATALDLLPGWFAVTMLRYPVERVVSHYNYHHEHGDDDHPDNAAFIKDATFEEWVHSEHCVDNLQTRFLCDRETDDLNGALGNLYRFDAVGILGESERGLQYIANRVTNVTKSSIITVGHTRKSTRFIETDHLPSELYEELVQRNAKDHVLIEIARSLL